MDRQSQWLFEAPILAPPLAKEKIKEPFNPFLGEVLPQSLLKQAGLTTEKWADQKAPALIQAAVEQSRVLRPFIANKLGKITISKNYHHYGTDDEFVYAYLKLNKIVVPFQQQKALTANVRAFYHRPSDSIHLGSMSSF